MRRSSDVGKLIAVKGRGRRRGVDLA